MQSPFRYCLQISCLLIFFAYGALAWGNVPGALIGKDYSSARKTLIREGWIPIRSVDVQMMEWVKKIQRQYPELDNCAMDKPVCSFGFKKNGKCLRVIALGEAVKSLVVSDIALECLSDNER
jgi:hypothetical protein